jgi:hypothetical protein
MSGSTQRVTTTVEIRRTDGEIEFQESGKEKSETTRIVVGQTIRWANRDSNAHRLVSDVNVEGKPLFDTGIIEPDGHKDVLIDIDLYTKAGGKPANVIRVRYRSSDGQGRSGELEILSAARRRPPLGRRDSASNA